MKLSVNDFAPPIFARMARAIRSRKPTETLFDGDEQLFKRVVQSCQTYGEYGMGASTLWVLANTVSTVTAVDTSREWVEQVVSANNKPSRLNALWVDVGAVGDWGRPKSYAKRDAFKDYVEALWQHPRKPEVVLVDGRFRVSCFLHSLLASPPGTKIIFDDYTNRPRYHLIEEILRPSEKYGRQALFETPTFLPREQIEDLRDSFLFVLD